MDERYGKLLCSCTAAFFLPVEVSVGLTKTGKDELKNDYINRYNELFTMMNTKVNIQDFDRLENKFDKVSETIAEVKTIVQIQMEERKNKKQ